MNKREKYYTEEQKEIMNFFKILVGLLIIIGIFYLLTRFVFNNKSVYKRTNNEGAIQYNYIYLGSLLNLADDEYYVLAVDSEDVSNTYILSLASSYRSNNKKIPLYYADLSFELNKGFKADTSNFDASSVNDLKIKNTTLIKVKNGKITSFVEKESEIETLLK